MTVDVMEEKTFQIWPESFKNSQDSALIDRGCDLVKLALQPDKN